ncbi:hypothetical protein A2867_02125 [Candidatus Daviesbacteria bacterium RIFCSPHIGHO2_01_FULL_40_11]|uniref:RNA polymerase sigma-70 region 4 domain-containing protein n=1 Tax=Candidatus Daviesbacteria bacterium RIFCSPHIGHO2_01_FULL_40_11 TaxID=1797762 RepID=A0A1F5JLW8_9BACT|nr:MAG: hypothetical protein A2867_02125 [Candidatus Daviesbacteria bacterium RIFCSPHIGHO2_01_FULL_40_11]
MPERLQVNPVESAVILLNEVFPMSRGWEKRGQYSDRIAKMLHGSGWRDWYHPENQPLTPDHFLQDPQKSSLLLETVDRVLETLTPREGLALRKRFGFQDGQLHSLEEVGKELSSVTRARARQIIAKSLRKLRHPSRGKHFTGLLPSGFLPYESR